VGAVNTGSIIPSSSSTSLVGAVRLQTKLFTAYGKSCEECMFDRYLICSTNNNTCSCPKNTIWDGIQCKNQGYENAACSSNQWCRQDVGWNCSGSNVCTGKTERFEYVSCLSTCLELTNKPHSCFLLVEYKCGNMIIMKADFPGNDLAQRYQGTFSSCCLWCQGYTGCRAFSWITAPGMFFGMCYLKTMMMPGGAFDLRYISAHY
jgi:hypothetical protein